MLKKIICTLLHSVLYFSLDKCLEGLISCTRYYFKFSEYISEFYLECYPGNLIFNKLLIFHILG